MIKFKTILYKLYIIYYILYMNNLHNIYMHIVCLYITTLVQLLLMKNNNGVFV